MQSLNVLQAQVESLKEMIELMERSSPDALAKKWRNKVYEELVRNKQQQILHSIEVRKFKDEEKKMKAKESQIKAALESAHLQASSLNMERNKLQKEVQVLQARLRSSNVSSGYLLNLQATLTGNLELNAKVLAMLDTFNHRITFSMSKIKTAKILHTREIFSLKNKLTEETNDQKQLISEITRLSTLEQTQLSLIEENESLSSQLFSLTSQFQQAETHAKAVLEETNTKFRSIVNQLELQLDEKVSEANSVFSQLSQLEKNNETLKKQTKELAETVSTLRQENEILSLTVQTLEKTVQDLSRKSDTFELDLVQAEKTIKKQEIQIAKLQTQDTQALSETKSLLEAVQSKDEHIQTLLIASQQLEEDLHQSQSTHETLRQKLSRLESNNKELRRERDILFETIKKTGARTKEEKEVQTDTQVKPATLKKTQARHISDDTF